MAERGPQRRVSREKNDRDKQWPTYPPFPLSPIGVYGGVRELRQLIGRRNGSDQTFIQTS
ncbi:hypothetical protein EYF80_001387 [Liparis tanakae]|uniref:Uncharacterized protein n=1 Tax=Liparis tanakae TaxID=230148 RepID=A0A4Z2JFL3_9TELE|nr:hypothetical protein EYF80_001387 [Liparis tanakae]